MTWSLGDLLILLDRTVLNPLLAGLSIGGALYVDPPTTYSFGGVKSHVDSSYSLSLLFKLLILATILRSNRFLSRKALNNGVSTTFDWSKEITVVTGGSSGIGAATVQRLAQKGGKVVVLDVLPLTFKPGLSHIIPTCSFEY